MKAKISRTLVIKSPIDLYKILNNKDELQSNISFQSFIEIVDKYLNGCRCITDISFQLMNDQYNSLSSNIDIIELMKSTILCDNVIFENNL